MGKLMYYDCFDLIIFQMKIDLFFIFIRFNHGVNYVVNQDIKWSKHAIFFNNML